MGTQREAGQRQAKLARHENLSPTAHSKEILEVERGGLPRKGQGPLKQEVVKQSRAGAGRAGFSGEHFRRPFGDSRSLALVPLCDPLPVTVGWRERPPSGGEDAVEATGGPF